MAEDVIGYGGGDGGVSLATQLAGFELFDREEAMAQEGEGRDDVGEGGAGDFLGVRVNVEFVDQVKVYVGEVARSVIKAGFGGIGNAAVVQAIEGRIHFQEAGLVGLEGLEVGAGARVDADGGRVDADGEDEAVIVLIDEGIGGLVAVIGGEVIVFSVNVAVLICGFIRGRDVVKGGVAEEIGVFIFPINAVGGDVSEGEIIKEDAIEEASVDAIDKARGEDGEFGGVYLEGDAIVGFMEGAVIEVIGGDLGGEVFGGDAIVSAPGVSGVVFGVKVKVDVIELVYGEHGEVGGVAVGVLEHGVGYDHVLLFLVRVNYVTVLADAIVVKGGADAGLGVGEGAGEVDGCGVYGGYFSIIVDIDFTIGSVRDGQIVDFEAVGVVSRGAFVLHAGADAVEVLAEGWADVVASA